ncbi:hypothetical protein NUU61_008561 [Penicillium alfredii]|uniref:Uncharacterized protein n=1 Tax=Penicillium alfredii TaxID=1506179 RepID=A0A9W9ELD6_9EURO|nr:uncharacterized protein NUU61_008561 [Penicillium alfredii]KAJ5083982.1 hypothetical protein NUU61_008561 [Penicillium alfredii]
MADQTSDVQEPVEDLGLPPADLELVLRLLSDPSLLLELSSEGPESEPCLPSPPKENRGAISVISRHHRQPARRVRLPIIEPFVYQAGDCVESEQEFCNEQNSDLWEEPTTDSSVLISELLGLLEGESALSRNLIPASPLEGAANAGCTSPPSPSIYASGPGETDSFVECLRLSLEQSTHGCSQAKSYERLVQDLQLSVYGKVDIGEPRETSGNSDSRVVHQSLSESGPDETTFLSRPNTFTLTQTSLAPSSPPPLPSPKVRRKSLPGFASKFRLPSLQTLKSWRAKVNL